MNSRRVVLQSIGAGLALGGVASGHVAASSDEHGTDALLDDLATVFSVTHRYHETDEAVADGYEAFDVLPPVGHIYQNTGYYDGAEFVGPTALDEPPALLFYAPVAREDDSDSVDLVLAGMEYHVSGDQTRNPPNLFADEDTSFPVTVCERAGWHRSPVPDALDVTGLHVWLYLANPGGLFHGGHPFIEHLVTS